MEIFKTYWKPEEVGKLLKIYPSKLRFYETQLPKSYLNPPRNKAGVRKYNRSSIRKLEDIIYLRTHGMTLKGITQAIRGKYIDELITFFKTHDNETT